MQQHAAMGTSPGVLPPPPRRDGWLVDAAVVVEETGFGVVVRPRGVASSDVLRAYLCRHRRAVLQVLHRAAGCVGGAVVLRGWQLDTSEAAESIVHDVLGITPLTPFGETLRSFAAFNERASRLGVSPDGVIQRERSRTVPRAKVGRMQPPHTEFGLGPHRPRVGAFYCEAAPSARSQGSTALCDLAATLEGLRPSDRERLARHGWWNPRTRVVQPWILVHPESGQRVLGQLYCLTDRLSRQALRAYQAVRSRLGEAYPEVVAMDDAGNDQGMDYGFELLREQSRPLALDDAATQRLLQSAFAHTAFFRWQTQDLLLFDNLLFAPWRMPGGTDRRLHAFFGDPIDTRTLCPDDAPACVLRDVQAPCRGGNQLVLDTLGLGGRHWSLTWLAWMPDWMFAWLGRQTWGHRASGDG